MAFKVSCWHGYYVYILAEPTVLKLVTHCLMKLMISGVIQGSVIDPLMFLVFINELI